MPTTVQVNKKTLQMLNEAKKEMGAKSHDEVIKKLLNVAPELEFEASPRRYFALKV